MTGRRQVALNRVDNAPRVHKFACRSKRPDDLLGRLVPALLIIEYRVTLLALMVDHSYWTTFHSPAVADGTKGDEHSSQLVVARCPGNGTGILFPRVTISRSP